MFILKGRSINGTVYYSFGGWSPNKADAERMTKEAAERRIVIRQALNKEACLNAVIGKLEVIDVTEEDAIRKTIVDYLTEGNTKEELAEWIYSLLPESEKEEILKDIASVNIEDTTDPSMPMGENGNRRID